MSALLLVFLPVGMLVAVARHLLGAARELHPRYTGQSFAAILVHMARSSPTHPLRSERRDTTAEVDAARDDIADVLIAVLLENGRL